jgi:hypothetical protein
VLFRRDNHLHELVEKVVLFLAEELQAVIACCPGKIWHIGRPPDTEPSSRRQGAQRNDFHRLPSMH